MIEVTIEEATARLEELMVSASQGEDVFIVQDGQWLVQMVPIALAEKLNSSLDEADTGPEDDPILSVMGSLSMGPLTNEEIDEELYGPFHGKEEPSSG